MSIEGQGHFFTIYFQGFVCIVLYKATISGEHLQDHWSSCLGLQVLNMCCNSAYMGRSTPTTDFDGAIGYFAYTM